VRILSKPTLWAVGGILTLLGQKDEELAAKHFSEKTWAAIEKEYGEETAAVLRFGLPGLIGLDVTGSLSILDTPYGQNFHEQVGRYLLGPTGADSVKFAELIGEWRRDKGAGFVQGYLPVVSRILKEMVTAPIIVGGCDFF